MVVLPLAAVAMVLATAPPPPASVPPVGAGPRVPLSASFSSLELVAAGLAAAGGTFLLAGGHLLLDSPSPSLSAPGRDSLDARLSRALYRRGEGRLLWSVPDRFGLVLPALPFLYYGFQTVSLVRTGGPVLGDDHNPHHRLAAYVEALGLVYLVTGVVKYTVGRPRPYTAEGNDHPELRRRRSEDNLSFFSGHAASTFAVGAFVAGDVSRAVRRRLPDGGERLLYGTILPYVVGYGLPTFITLSRVVDQQHWPSDVLAGAVVGAVVASGIYALHFDAAGHPRRRHGRPDSLSVLALPLAPATPAQGGAAAGFSLTATGSF